MQKFKVELLIEAAEFLENIETNAREKIYFNIKKSQHRVDPELLKKLNSNIWEFRTLYKGIAYRLFAFWNPSEKSLIIATHGLIKKTQKTPQKEIEKAEKIRHEYLEFKKSQNGK